MSPRPTSQELQAAKKQKQEAATAEKQRQAEEGRRLNEAISNYMLLESVTLALYTELAKLANKAPKETLTRLTLEKVNAAVRDVKALLPDDENIKDIRIFEPAGDNPEYRDAVLVLSLLRAGLDRFHQRHRSAISMSRF